MLAACTLLSLQEVGCPELQLLLGRGWLVLAGDVCSAIKVLFLIHDLLPYKELCCKQTGQDSSLLQSHPGGRNRAWSGQGLRGVVEWARKRRGLGLMQTAWNRWLLESHWLAARGGCSGSKDGPNLWSDRLVHSSSSLKIDTAKGEKRQTRK